MLVTLPMSRLCEMARAVDGSGGDGGRDRWVETDSGEPVVHETKSFTDWDLPDPWPGRTGTRHVADPYVSRTPGTQSTRPSGGGVWRPFEPASVITRPSVTLELASWSAEFGGQPSGAIAPAPLRLWRPSS
ncbi:hypothetical protein [Streptomyces canus]|uniref:hypothetical protein n=1 Tax=Streptomyces canus TaxID=58343 RepID=UPI00278AE376|nr:hypothetical protein [Streptomyces canus]MDQ0766710.1 hypothetical protein [Streptomyces canus]